MSRAFLSVGGYLALVLLLFHVFNILEPAFRAFLFAASACAVVHHLLPARLRRGSFVAASLGCAATAIAPGTLALCAAFATGVWALARYVPRAAWRWSAAAAALGVCAALRARDAQAAMWTVFGGMFMFRTFLFLHDVEDGRKEPLSGVLAYLLMAPNFLFPLFPPVDYTVFKIGWERRERAAIALDGVDAILRGAVQILAYRWFEHTFYATPDETTGVVGLALFSACALASLLRVTGTYHIAVGILQLYGFDLPRPSERYLLARSFLEFWGRSNVYWKNAMVKVIYLPVMLRLRAHGRTRSVLAAAAAVFAATWVLHAYQSFWITGVFRLRAVDAAYWGAMGVGVAASLVRPTPETPLRVADLPRVALCLAAVAALWGMVAFDGVGAWLSMLRTVL